MEYQFEPVRELMESLDLITINLVWCESESCFHSRNPFAVGGVYEDPATGAAAAALAGYLRDIGWPGAHQFDVIQGEDMGVPSRLHVECGRTPGESVRVSGQTRYIGIGSGRATAFFCKAGIATLRPDSCRSDPGTAFFHCSIRCPGSGSRHYWQLV